MALGNPVHFWQPKVDQGGQFWQAKSRLGDQFWLAKVDWGGGGGALLIAKVDFKKFNFVEYSQ